MKATSPTSSASQWMEARRLKKSPTASKKASGGTGPAYGALSASGARGASAPRLLPGRRRYERGLERLGARVRGEGVERPREVEHPAGRAGREEQRERAVLAAQQRAGAQERVQAARVEERDVAEVEHEGARGSPYGELDGLGEAGGGRRVEVALQLEAAGAADPRLAD